MAADPEHDTAPNPSSKGGKPASHATQVNVEPRDSEDLVDEFGLKVKNSRSRTYDDQDIEAGEGMDRLSHEGSSDDETDKGFRTPLSEPAQEADMPSTTKEPEHSANDTTVSKPPKLDTSAVKHSSPQPTEATTPAEQKPSEEPPASSNKREAGTPARRPKSQVETGSPEAHKSAVSEWSHMQMAAKQEEEEEDSEGDWQEMPAYAKHTIYDDWGKVLAREEAELNGEPGAYENLGGAGKGYTKVQLDEDALSATSMDDDTAYLFKQGKTTTLLEEDEEGRDMLGQMQATKELLTEGQRIAYVGIVRICTMDMYKEMESLNITRGTKKTREATLESLVKWSQKMMIRLYGHMDIESAEQVMIEQLAEHGVQAGDLTPPLMQNARVRNPVRNQDEKATTDPQEVLSPKSDTLEVRSPGLSSVPTTPGTPGMPVEFDEDMAPDDMSLHSPSAIADQKKIDIDLRWTVLCDLFLILVADSSYDSRSRSLLERVGKSLSVEWIDICRFEKRITDALEMQEAADKEKWNEDDHMQQREKAARNRKLVMMGLATVGGGLVIGLSAGLLAPVIGAGLAAGFTTIGVAGTSTFFGGVGAAALITSTGIVTGGTIGVRASSRRMGAVKTFEYRPLHNNKRVNLIVTVAGWMTGKVDDVRLPFSTIDPIMGDIYSVLWEPEMLQSMGQTINILATEALTQGLQQILSSTILTALMGALQLPIVLTKLAYLIDNPWNVSLARADQAGLILADSLIDRNLGSRPITLVGFSIGSRVIFACLKELAKKGAYGIVQNVYLYGSPMVVNKDDYTRARAVVPGRFVNGYATNDWILGYLFRATSGGIAQVAGLAPIKIAGIEDVDVTEDVQGHMAYRAAMPKLMQKAGWEVESLEFSEIEDPDPENHDKRQRELINEIEEARKQLDEKPEKKGIKALFSRNKKNAEKKEWETYDEQAKAQAPVNGDAPAHHEDDGSPVLFDIDAITKEVAELAAQGVEIKEIKSTLPPMKLEVHTGPGPLPSPASTVTTDTDSPARALRQMRSFSTDGGTPGLTPASSIAPPEVGNALLSPPQAKKPAYSWWRRSSRDEKRVEPAKIPEGRRSPSLSSQGGATPKLSHDGGEGARPVLHTAQTMPVVPSEKNAWAEEDEFGQPKKEGEEVEMTFE
ncbi:DUF726-domain-containing protein [Myriangium duriaei CBS 260.36]|uniref:DUF726-domain-containing protein n=1 Tax=Myriangium duriaei CBS 260.36 TaxID=1168546 RepID=A0A9P4J9I3_9PEZI|nr:DUF726-domain-containing protein [Myriangium duriaei CBS 260.36]